MRIGDVISEWRRHDCGSPQGTLLGPESWLNLIDPLAVDLHSLVKASAMPGCTLLYADDILI